MNLNGNIRSLIINLVKSTTINFIIKNIVIIFLQLHILNNILRFGFLHQKHKQIESA